MLNLSGYQITEEIHANAQRVVYRGIRLDDQLPVILKCLQGDDLTPTEIARLQHEYEITHNLDITGVVKALAFLTDNSYPVLILSDFGGISLKDFIKNHKLSLRDFLTIAIQIAQTLGELYQHNIIHKDIKPSNIIIKPETLEVRITDFAIASQLSRENAIVSHPNLLEGTLAYMSPEQTGRMNRSVDYRSDFYSLGVTFYEMLTGELPCYADDPMEMVHCHIARQPVPLWKGEGKRETGVGKEGIIGEIPKAVSDIAMKLLAKTAEERYQSAFGLKTDLETCLTQLQEKGKIEEFQLGKRDFSGQLQIPQKLYGREKELARLMAAFERVSSGKTEMMLVAGYSGIGKSALVQEIHKPLVRYRGYFISGKFDQFKRNIPFEPIIQAFRDLIRQLLSESSQQIARWKQKLAAALRANGRVIIEVIPEVELIVGKQPPVPDLGATESQNRFNLVFQKFIAVFTQKEHPLVIFLDDLQWADLASLKLIQRLMTEGDSRYLLLIGAYRDNEVSPVHPLMLTLSEIQKTGATVNTITLDPLDRLDLNCLIADTLACSTALAMPLTELIYQKTKGNPFFSTQFLKSLHKDGLIAFNFEAGHWQCDIVQVRTLALTDDVVEFLALQLRKFPTPTQEILKLAACIGNQFDLATLTIVNEKSQSETVRALWKALQEGLILPVSEVYKFYQEGGNNLSVTSREKESDRSLRGDRPLAKYKFLHDRVQQAAYSLIPDEKKQATHLQIGQLLLQNSSDIEQDEKIFEIVRHLNQGKDLITQSRERQALAELNLVTGRKAKTSNGYAAATVYLQTAMGLLTTDCWQNQYELTLNIYIATAEAEYLNLNFEESLKLAKFALMKAKGLLEKVKIYELKMQIHIAQQIEIVAAVDIGLEVLEKLTISLPKIELDKELIIDLPNLDDLDNLPLMTDPYKLAAMQILKTLCTPVFVARPEMFPQIIITMINLCLKYGDSAISSFAYGFYGLLLVGLGQLDRGYQAGLIALKLLDKFNAKELKAKVYNLFNGNIRTWKEPAKNSVGHLREGVQAGLEIGDFEWGGYCAANLCSYLFFTEDNLESAVQQQEVYGNFCINVKQESSSHFSQVWRQLGLNLQRQAADPLLLIGKSFDEEKTLPRLIAAKSGIVLFMFYLAKTILGYLLGDSRQALKNVGLAQEQAGSAFGFMQVVVLNFYHSLTLLNRYAEVTVDEQKNYLEQVNINQEKMKFWAAHAPMNHLHKYHLVEAEKHRVLNQKNEAIKLYDLSIKGARENEYLQEEALAYELAAKFYFDWGKDKIAKVYITDAYAGYIRWGAHAKVKDLESKYPYLISKTPIATPKGFQTITNTTILKTNDRTSPLDFTTVLKASQAIAGEIVLDNLLTKLMLIVMENAGAQSGVLLLNREGQLFMEAAGTFDPEQVLVRQSIPVETSNLPFSIINYVARIQEDVVLNDASREGNFTSDRYIIDRQLKSVLCTPILSQGKLIGILYLENNLTIGAFTPGRLDVLKLLCSQAAISLENAQLYASLEQKVEERTLQLNEKNQRLTREIQERQRVEEALRLSEERFRAVFESTDDSIGVWDKNYNCLYANSAMLGTLGITSEEAIAKNIRQILEDFPELLSLWIDRFDTVFQTQHSMHLQNATQFGDRTFYFESTLSPIKDSAGNIFAVGVVSRDITSRKEAEEALRQSEERYRAVVEDQTELICRFLPDGTLTFVNDAYCRYFNKLHEELIGYSFMPVIPDEDQLKIKQCLASLNSDNPIATVEHRVLFGKHERWHQWTDRAIFDETGNFIEFQGVGRDISDRKLAEEALSQSEQQYRNLVETSQEIIFSCDAEGRFTFVNQAVKHIHGYEPEEMIGRPFSDFVEPSEQIAKDREVFQRILAGESFFQYESVHLAKDARPINLLFNTIVLRNVEGNVIGITGTASDMTKRKRAEEALQKAKEAADAASKAKGEFLSKMSHELRTPLNAILGFTQILNRDSFLNSQQQDYVGIISRAGEHLLTLINDVLEMSKIEAGRIELNESSFDLYRLLNSLHEMLQLKAESKGLKLIFDVSPGVSQSVKTDETKLRQVLINLLGNAVKFTEKGGVTLRVRQKPEERKANAEFAYCVLPSAFCLFFEVEDTGSGIAPEELSTIFDPFVQTETGRKSQSGTGLGLPISRQFVQLMGGDIAVSSTVGEGTIVKFEIQISRGEGVDAEAPLQNRRAIALQPNQPVYRILVVEDKWESRLLLVNLLSPLGFEVREAVNGQEAVTISESWQPHLIWMDMQMPVMDGYEATQLIKATPAGRGTTIIALTASAFEENRTSVLSAGCDDFVSKPFREEVIFEKMAEYLGVRYIYEEIPVSSDAIASVREKSAKGELTPDALASLPAEWIAQLHQAATELDDEAIALLAQAIRSLDAPLADALADLAKKLRFDKIVELTQKANP